MVARALLSVSDKAGLVEFAKELVARNVELLSTGGTAKAIRTAGLPVIDVSEFTGSPEIMDGRVKTLHPRVHGGILMRENGEDEKQLDQIGGKPIDLVVVNLYPFEATVARGAEYAECIENIDIGGPTMVRAAAKNHARVAIVVDPSDYATITATLDTGGPSMELRTHLAAKAFAHTAGYDKLVSEYMMTKDPLPDPGSGLVKLKYGCNPHQQPASIQPVKSQMPFQILNGTPGYINLLDAINAWQLVSELRKALGLPASASFKHVSPAGAAVAVPITDKIAEVYEVKGKELSPAALAYLRARQADPLCSFGDFAALSDVVDEQTAMFLKTEVSDGIIAPGFEPAALEILKAKKGGKYIVLQADPDFSPPDIESREIYGVKFSQKRNDVDIGDGSVEKLGAGDALPDAAKRDLLLAQITLKYTQSNSVGYALDGQMVGVGAGQQSRVDCVKLAGRKVETWYLRQHPKVLGLKFKEGVKRQDRINSRVAYIEGEFTDSSRAEWEAHLAEVPAPLTLSEKEEFLGTLSEVSLASDAFFPFRDSIDVASKRGVKYVVHAGGSVQDEAVGSACAEYGMTMAHSGIRLFHH